MLNKRTNILFDTESWEQLEYVAKKRGVSHGEVVRDAVRKTFEEERIQDRRQKAIGDIRKIRKQIKGHTDYKELINYGRKY